MGFVREEEQRIAGLEEAQRRAQVQVRDNRQAVTNAEAELSRLREVDTAELAYNYANNRPQDRLTIREQEAAIDRARAELQHIEQVDSALEGELRSAETRLRLRRGSYHDALAEVVITSPEYQDLFVELDKAWGRIRGLRKCFDEITRQLHGSLPGRDLTLWQQSPPLDWNVLDFPLDEEPYRRWSDALRRLLNDPDTPLPNSED
jgi:hypothetical protein